tara:strand:+ start:28 stop:750 length:723 start_codon:yes stop_codon:yes gene_type:complete
MLRAKRALGQNFLKDKNICNKITNLTNINNKVVLEIGPGYGFLTDVILKKSPKKLYIIEKDFELSIYLKKKYNLNKKVIIINDDILNMKLNTFKEVLIISNLPYNISTKIITHLFNFNENINEMIFMIQREVAKKFDYLLPRMNKYKFLTKIVSTYHRCFDVSPNVFIPKPKVTSTVVKFTFNKKVFNLRKAENFSNLIFKNIRKKISSKMNNKSGKHILYEKRVDQLSIDEILDIYNFF